MILKKLTFGEKYNRELSIFGLGENDSGLISQIFFIFNFQLAKIDSSLLFFSPKSNFYKIKNPKNLEKVTRIFFSQRRKMLKKPFNQLFNGDQKIIDKLQIDLNLRPQNLNFDTYYKLTIEYEKLIS